MSFKKALPILAAGCALALGACSAIDHGERDMLQQHGIGGPLYEKMRHGEPLDLSDVVELSHRGVPTPFIIHYMRDSYFVYHLKAEDTQELKRAGVAREIIDYMMATPGMYGPRNGGPYPYGPYPYGSYPYGPYGYGYGPYGPGPYFYGGGRYYHRW